MSTLIVFRFGYAMSVINRIFGVRNNFSTKTAYPPHRLDFWRGSRLLVEGVLCHDTLKSVPLHHRNILFPVFGAEGSYVLVSWITGHPQLNDMG